MGSFEVTESAIISAPAEQVHPLINTLKNWQQWSPWEGVDPDLQRTYTGPEAGVGASYAWSGNRKAGAGRMEISSSTPTEIDITLEFTAPFKATNVTHFQLEPSSEDATKVTWTMTGERGAFAGVIMGLLGVDKMISKDFTKGLASLNRVAVEQS